MAAPHKGDRELIATRPLRPVYDAIKAEAAGKGISISQYVADLLAVHVGRPELVRELNLQEVLPISA